MNPGPLGRKKRVVSCFFRIESAPPRSIRLKPPGKNILVAGGEESVGGRVEKVVLDLFGSPMQMEKGNQKYETTIYKWLALGFQVVD